MQLGETLKRARIEKCMTLQELSSKCGLCLTTISQVENNKKKPYLSTIKKICNALEIDSLEIVRKFY